MSRAKRMFAVALLALTAPASAAPETGHPSALYISDTSGQVTDATSIPVAIIERAKFSNEDPLVVDALQFINAYVNAAIIPVDDKSHYGIDDFWVMAPKDSKGDCEDYALTKLFMLGQAGFNMVQNTKVTFVIVTDFDAKGHRTYDGHAILAVRMPHGSVGYFDNLHKHMMTRPELEREGYIFQDW